MITGLILGAIGLCLLMLISATINMTLRRPGRARLEQILKARGKDHLREPLDDARHDLSLWAATVRTASTLALVMVVMKLFETQGREHFLLQYVSAFASLLILVLVFGIAAPNAWSKYAGESLLVTLLPVLLATIGVFKPVSKLVGFVDDLVRRLADAPREDEEGESRHEQELLDAVSEGERVGAVDQEEKQMIRSIMDLRDTDVAEIMTPRTDIQSVDKTATLTEVKELISRAGHSRIPVHDETVDNIVGILYAKDLLHDSSTDDFDATRVMREAHFIPETKNLRDLLHEFRTQKFHIAIVLDEYGGTAGLVTIEDILEELVGEIVDEYDADEPEPITRVDEHTIDVDARVRIDEINEELAVALPEDDDYETIGGFVFARLGKIPEVGDQCEHENIAIKVVDAEPRRINRLRLCVKPSGADHNGD